MNPLAPKRQPSNLIPNTYSIFPIIPLPTEDTPP
jgi:hypothetical protein